MGVWIYWVMFVLIVEGEFGIDVFDGICKYVFFVIF